MRISPEINIRHQTNPGSSENTEQHKYKKKKNYTQAYDLQNKKHLERSLWRGEPHLQRKDKNY